MALAATIDRPEARAAAYALPLDKINVADPVLFQNDAIVALFRAAAARRPGALLRRARIRTLLVDHQIQRHHGGRHQSRGVLVGAQHHHRRSRQ